MDKNFIIVPQLFWASLNGPIASMSIHPQSILNSFLLFRDIHEKVKIYALCNL